MWQVRIHELVLKEDFKKIDKSWVSRILKIIYKKLSVYPEQFGSPLRHQLRRAQQSNATLTDKK